MSNYIVIKDGQGRPTTPSTSSAPQEPTGELTDDEKSKLDKELANRHGSKIVRCEEHKAVKVRGKITIWPWKIRCGICSTNIQLRFDAGTEGRISSFDRHHYTKCNSNLLKTKKGGQRSLKDMLTGGNRKGSTQETGSKRQRRSPMREEVDSDIDLSDYEMTCSSYESDGSSDNSYESEDVNTGQESDDITDTEISCSCEISSDLQIDSNDDLCTVYVGVEEADPLCVKINDLLRRGKIDKKRIFYRFLSDVVEIMYNPFHEYDREVVEFFNTITYLGGKRTANFIRGPMNLGDGKHSHTKVDRKMNLGGPSESVCSKQQAGYTTESGVIKPLSLGHVELLKNSKAKPLIETPKVVVFPCAFANDGTALKPAIEFDPRIKENVGLKFPVDLRYVQKNPTPSAEHLKENIVTEAIVSSLTSLDNFCSLPIAVDYATQTGKTGKAMSALFEQHIKTLQTCASCQRKTQDRRHVMDYEHVSCNSFCEVCYNSRKVCENCKLLGQVSHIPSLRFCNSCNDENTACIRRAIMVLCSDCESGNKNAFECLKEKLEDGTIDPELAFLSILPDCPHVGKSMKASFSNWWLKCKDERINLAMLRTLRNRSDKATKDKFRKAIPKNDHVKNKDRQDPSAVLTLTSEKVTTELRDVGYVCHTIIPGLDKYSADNQLGMYPSPINVAVPSYGWIVFLSYDTKSAKSTLYKARLHSPVDKIAPIAKHLEAKEIHCSEGIIFLSSENGPIKAVEFTEGAISIKAEKLKRKDDLVQLATRLGIPCKGTVAELKARIKKYLEKLSARYVQNSVKSDEIHFWDCEKQPSFEAMACADSELLYAAETTQKAIVSFQLEKDGIGVKGIHQQVVIHYDPEWRKITSMCLCNGSIFLSHCKGISKIILETGECTFLVEQLNQPCFLTTFGEGVLYSNPMKASVWHLRPTGEQCIFAGSDLEEGSTDGPVKSCRFKQPMGVCTEFDSVVYICDAQTNSIKICSKLTECARFLSAIGALYAAFSVHSKGSKYTVKPPEEALTLVQHCKAMLDENADDIRRTTRKTGSLNGPEGHISAKTVASVALVEWGLKRLFANLKEFDYHATNLLSCMTLDVENCHSTVHIKQPNMSMAEYSRSFGLTMKESVKRITQWAAYYHTSRRSWYPKPEEAISFSEVPTMKPLEIVEMSKVNCDVMRSWVSSYGAAARQRTVRQETTMARHGTLPEFMYQRQCKALDNPVSILFHGNVDNVLSEELEDTTVVSDNAIQGEVDEEFDTSSDEDVEDEIHPETETFLQEEIGNSATFLLGAQSRFGRVIRFNNRLLF